MLFCQGVVPNSSFDTLWASSWSSRDFLPTLWSSGSLAEEWSNVGGENRCAGHCSCTYGTSRLFVN